MKQGCKRRSLSTHLILTITFCWVLPILLVALSGGYLLYRNYDRSRRQELELAGSYAIRQTASRFENILFESKTVSYDGVVRNAYRLYQIDGDSAALYRTVSNYLKQRFSRRESVDAVFLSFWFEPRMLPYMSNQGDDSSRAMLSAYTETAPGILNDMADADTKVRLYYNDGLLYAARNLFDGRLQPYATVVVLCDAGYLAAPLASLNLTGPAFGTIDGYVVSADGTLSGKDDAKPRGEDTFEFSAEAEGHSLVLYAELGAYDVFFDVKDLWILVAVVAVLVVFLLFAVLRFFTKQVSRPVKTLVEATGLVRNGERGYRITETAENREFEALYLHFNSMSEELQKQFDIALREQQALHQARIKALQSQINPHFLNNTLEIINWEARLAGNERISDMIEALALMLSTSLNRDDNPLITLRDELKYAEAYLYIIKQRMGDRLKIIYETDETLSEQMIPRMILQPIAENAVEHDLSRMGGGKLVIRTERQGMDIVLSVEHDGHILPEDRERLERLLKTDANEPWDRVHIGMRNVSRRLQLIYGEKASLTVEEREQGVISAKIVLPFRD